MRWRSAAGEADRGLSAERKALAERYTIDAGEAQQREQPPPPVAPAAACPPAERPAPAQKRELPIQRWASPLAEQLAKLREHLDEAVARAVDPPADEYDRLRNLGGQGGHLRCAGCGREGSRGENGWTLRLCSDDQLHTFCHDCYEHEFGKAS